MPSLTAAAVAERAKALVGTRFRPQGRRPEHGLDCLGLVAISADLPPKLLPSGYRLRSEIGEELLATSLHGRVRRIAKEEAGEGDVLLVRAGLGQNHFVILVADGFVHADARIGRVVETRGRVNWPVRAAWRIEERASWQP